MPELPEIETLKLQLSPILKGQVIKDVEIRNPKTFYGDKKQIIGQRIINIGRTAKIFMIDLENKVSIAIHLKMSGRLIIHNSIRPAGGQNWEIDYSTHKHTRVVFTFKSGDKLYFWDQRKFGWVKILDESGIKKQESRLGVEPFTKKFTPENLYTITSKAGRPIKVVLMDQSLIAGIGNIYANDGLFCAKIHPKTKAKELTREQISTLFDCLLMVLKNGIKYKGASENLFRDAFGQKGSLQEHFYVYAREKQKCLNNCGSAIKKVRLGGRGSFYCPSCQPIS